MHRTGRCTLPLSSPGDVPLPRGLRVERPSVTLRLLVVSLLAAGPVLAPAAEAGAPPATPVQAKPAHGQAAPAASSGKAADTKAARKKPGASAEMHAVIEAPLFTEAFASVPVAAVDGELITLEQLMAVLSLSHQARTESAGKRDTDFRPALDRLIDMKLCVQEAVDMGLDELPEVKEAIHGFEEPLLVGQLEGSVTKDVKADAAEVDRIYKEAVRELKLRSLLFDKEEDAQAFKGAVAGGKPFEPLAKQLLADKKAKGSLDADYVGLDRMLPQVRQAIGGAPAGALEIVKGNEGWSVVQVLDARYPDNALVRAKVEAASLEGQQDRVIKKFREGLVKKYARTDEKLLGKLDLEAPKPGFKALRKDQRAVVRIAGEKPVTVADLAHGMELKFFHGIEGPIKEHKVNDAKLDVLDKLVGKRVLLKEARRRGIPATREYRQLVSENRDATLFAAYLERVVRPEVKVTEKEGQEYYDQHKAEFMTPAMYKLESLTFSSAKDAQAALDKLRGGTDFQWLRANAGGQIKEDARAAQLDGVVLSASSLPGELRQQLSGTKAGDYRMTQIGDQYSVLRVANVTPGAEQSYAQSRGAIGKKLIGENFGKAIKETAAKLRAEHEVVVYMTKLGY